MSKNSKIKDDCFALPKGLIAPVDTALEKLKNGLSILPEEKFIPQKIIRLHNNQFMHLFQIQTFQIQQ